MCIENFRQHHFMMGASDATILKPFQDEADGLQWLKFFVQTHHPDTQTVIENCHLIAPHSTKVLQQVTLYCIDCVKYDGADINVVHRALRQWINCLTSDDTTLDAAARLSFQYIGHEDTETWITPLSTKKNLAFHPRFQNLINERDFSSASKLIEENSIVPDWPMQMQLIIARDGQDAGVTFYNHLSNLDPPPANLEQVSLKIAMANRDFLWADRIFSRLEKMGAPCNLLDQAQRKLEADNYQSVCELIGQKWPDGCLYNAPPRVHLLLCRAFLGMGQNKEAEALAKSARSLYFRHENLQSTWLQARLRQDKWAEIDSELTADHVQVSPNVHIRFLIKIGHIDVARARFEEWAIKAPGIFGNESEALDFEIAQSEGRAINVRLSADTLKGGLARIETALLFGDIVGAKNAASRLKRTDKNRMSVLLARARLSFLQGRFDQTKALRDRFIDAKITQLGRHPERDLRDEIYNRARSSALEIFGHSRMPEYQPADLVSVENYIIRHPKIANCAALSAFVLYPLINPTINPGTKDTPKNIPNHIFFYWDGPRSQAVDRTITQWRVLHPNTEIRIFDHESATHWLEANVESTDCIRFSRLSQPAMAADFFRLCYLSIEGGLYVDVDEYPRQPVDDLLHGNLVLQVEKGHSAIANNFIAARPEHPLITCALTLARDNLDKIDDPYAWTDTGPGVMSRALVHAFLSGNAVEDIQSSQIRILRPSEYLSRISTNLELPHKQSDDHWR